VVKTSKVRKGVTIAETMVALALVSIMITLVVSFVLSITKQTKANASNDAMRRDCILIESAAERWMNKLVGQPISNSTDKKTLTATVDSTTYTLKFENNAIVGTLPNGENIKFYTESVTKITFELLKNDSELLLICTVTCKYQEGENTEEFKICVNPHVGDTYKPT
jgi:type II secretory pathway pseudopilin PulG